MKLFSVILPTRNRLDGLRRSLECLKNQTCKNFEVIVVDDASTMPSSEMIMHWLKASGLDYFYIRNYTQQGTGVSYKKGTAAAQGEYVCFFADDDLYLLNRFELLKDYVLANNHPAWIHENTLVTDEAGTEAREAPSVKDYSELPAVALLHDFQKGKFPFGGTVSVKRDAFLKAGGFRDFYYCEDFDLWLRLLDSGLKLHKRPGPAGYIYLDHKGKHMDLYKKNKDMIRALSEFCETSKHEDLKREARIYKRQLQIRNFGRWILQKLRLR